jgi:hypothetical protein
MPDEVVQHCCFDAERGRCGRRPSRELRERGDDGKLHGEANRADAGERGDAHHATLEGRRTGSGSAA